MHSKLYCVLGLSFTLLNPGCGGNDSTTTAGTPLPSTWAAECSGTYASSVYSATGPFEVSLSESGGALTGSLTVNAIGMYDTALTGTAQGAEVVFGDIGQRISFTGALRSAHGGFTGSGTYKLPELSDHGSWTVNCAFTSVDGTGGGSGLGNGNSGGTDNTAGWSSTNGLPPSTTGGSGAATGTSNVCQAVGSVAISDARGVFAANGYAYVAAASQGLVVVDTSNPLSPQIVGALATAGSATAVTVSGQTAYVLDSIEGLVIVDVSNPLQPAQRGVLARPSSVPSPNDGAVVVSGSVAYVAGLDAWGIYSVDVSDLSLPKNLGNTGDSPFGVDQLAIQGSWLFAAGLDGLAVVNVSNADAPLVTATLNDLTFASDLALVGQTAYVPCMSGLKIVDISAPLTPVELTSNSSNGVNAIAAAGSVAYVGVDDNLVLEDTTVPTAPKLIGQCPIGVTAARLAVDNHVVYVAAGTDGFRVVQIN